MDMAITYKQYRLLALIDESTTWEGDTRPGVNLTCYWVPRVRPQYAKCLLEPVSVSGSGDANMIKGFERKGLITFQPVTKYACAITEQGILELERYREAYIYPESNGILVKV